MPCIFFVYGWFLFLAVHMGALRMSSPPRTIASLIQALQQGFTQNSVP